MFDKDDFRFNLEYLYSGIKNEVILAAKAGSRVNIQFNNIMDRNVNPPVITVFMPASNGEAYIEKAIQSVFNQLQRKRGCSILLRQPLLFTTD